MAGTFPICKPILTPGGVTVTGAIVNAALAVSKISAGLLCASQTILADGLHSASDLVTDFVVLAGIGVEDRPADKDHHYGHRRIGTLAALFVGAMLLGAAGWILYSAVAAVRRPQAHRIRPVLPLVLALVSVVLKELLFWLTRLVARRTGKLSLLANAWHHRSDAFTSVAAAAGLAGVMLGGADWAFLDSLTATVLSAFLIVVAARIIGAAASELIDRAPDTDTLARIE